MTVTPVDASADAIARPAWPPRHAALCAQIRESSWSRNRTLAGSRRGAALVVGVCHTGDCGVSILCAIGRLRRGPRWGVSIGVLVRDGVELPASRLPFARCIRRVWRTWCAERAPCPRINPRSPWAPNACRRLSSPTRPDPCSTSHAITEHGSPLSAGACSSQPRDSSTR